ncbi:GNAT family N-acetyltransferase [Pseudogemmobacter bohemicus]|uniref:GNAT family N-acetyltransferase n=1 Tax=Pseudogemmobacter bohemicus TaxID=2250708 RepID=UPI000DD45211|nr:GNAT family N-acetyltransferase [Pseudogemmobacter bohemicus]
MTSRPFGPGLRPMMAADLPAALRLSREAGWPHRAEDWALVLQTGEGFVATGPGGEVLGTAMRSHFGVVSMANMIIVSQSLRGRGIGRRLLEAVLALAPDDEWRLVATPEGLPLYQSLGFTPTGIVRQYQGQLSGNSAPLPGDAELRWSDAADHQTLIALDLEATGADRRSFYAALPKEARLAVLPVTGGQHPDSITAFGLLRPFGQGLSLAPLIARDAQAATGLLRGVAVAVAGRFLRLDTITPQGADCPLAGALAAAGLPLVNRGTEMIRPARSQATPPTPANFYRFALAAQALG